MTKFFNTPYLLVIETNRYSGNFERQLTAYSIGSIGECGVGDNEAQRFAQEEPEFFDLCDYTIGLPDDHGNYRPCSIMKDVNGEYTSVAIFLEDLPTEDELAVIARRAFSFPAYWKDQRWCSDKYLQVLGMKVIKQTITVEQELLSTYP